MILPKSFLSHRIIRANTLPAAAAALSALLLLAGAVAAHGPQHNPVRATYVAENGIPAEYRDLENLSEGDPDAIQRGRVLYAQVCAVCHGATGGGDGPGASSLEPAPASLNGGMMNMQGVTDGYLFWTISEGGTPTGSAMPPMKDVFSEADIWTLVSFLRHGFDEDGGTGRENGSSGDEPSNDSSSGDRHHGGHGGHGGHD